MPGSVGTAFLTIVPKMASTKPIETDLAATGATAGGKFSGGFKKAAIGVAAVTAAAGAAAVGIKSLVDSTASMGDTIDKDSQKMGISAQSYQEWGYVLERNGASIDTLKTGMKTLQSNISDGSEAFGQLGVSLTNADGSLRSTDAVLNDSISKLAGMENQADRTAMANQLFGKRTAQELAPMLNSGSASIDQLKKKANELGIVMSDDAVKASAEYEDAMTDFNGALTGVKNTIGAAFVPALTGMATSMSEKMAGISKRLKDNGGDWGKTITDIAGDLGKALPGILVKVVNLIKKYAPKILEAGIKLLGGLIKAVPKALPGIIKGVAGLVVSLVKVIGGAVSDFVSAGADMVAGLWKGLKEKFKNWILGKIDGLISLLPKAVKKLLGIHSPSRVFKEIGEQCMAGMGLGFETGTRGALRSASSSVNRLTRLSTSVATAGARGTVGNTYIINGLTYDDGSAAARAVDSLTRAVTVMGRA